MGLRPREILDDFDTGMGYSLKVVYEGEGWELPGLQQMTRYLCVVDCGLKFFCTECGVLLCPGCQGTTLMKVTSEGVTSACDARVASWSSAALKRRNGALWATIEPNPLLRGCRMGHRCGINCYRKRGRRSDCPSCKNSKKQAKLAHIKKGRRYARKVMSNPHPYRSVARLKHPEPTDEQIEETLADPYTAEPAPHDFNRVVYYSYIPDAGSGKWLEVVVQDDRLFNAYFRRDLLKSWGRP